MKLYTLLLFILVSILSTLLFTRKDIDTTIMRTPGQLFQERGTDSVTNLYNIKVANKTMKEVPLLIKLEGISGGIEIIGSHHQITVQKEGQGAGSFFVVLPKNLIRERKSTIRIGLYEGNKKLDEIRTSFLGPVNE